MEAVKVYITNASGHDYSGASAYGEFVWITKGYVSFGSLDRVKYGICEAIKDSKPTDWLLLSGTLLISCIAVAAWYEKHKQVKLLIVDRGANKPRYRELILSQHNFQDIERLVNA